jgi:RimJ/RimL family protein N-acetyltransferase
MAGMSLFGFRPRPDERPDDEPWPEVVWPMPDGVELRGEVVTLRLIRPGDHEELRRALDDPQVWEHLSTPQPEDTDAMGRLVDALRDKAFHPWVLRLSRPLPTRHGELPAGAVVGWSSFLEVAPRDARLEIGNTAYAPAVWGTAVNPEAKLLLLGYAFEGLGMGRVQLKTDVRNVRSQRAIAGIGATYEGVLRRYQRRADGTVRDTVVFSVTAEDWPEVRRRLEARVGASTS